MRLLDADKTTAGLPWTSWAYHAL